MADAMTHVLVFHRNIRSVVRHALAIANAALMPKNEVKIEHFDLDEAVRKIQTSWRPGGKADPTIGRKLVTIESLGVNIPAYSPEKAEKLKPVADPPFTYRFSKKFADYLAYQKFQVDGSDLEIVQPKDTRPTITTATGDVVPDPEVVLCSFCGTWTKHDVSTFGMGNLTKMRTTEVIVINKVRTIKEKLIHTTPKLIACPSCSLKLQATTDEDGDLVKHTKFSEPRG